MISDQARNQSLLKGGLNQKLKYLRGVLNELVRLERNTERSAIFVIFRQKIVILVPFGSHVACF